ncbi:MAG: tyrosine-type recombinase/integrase [Syntrophales bacterium]
MKQTMRLFQRKGWYHVEFYRGKGKALKTRDAKEATALFKEMEKEYLRGRLINLESIKKCSLSEFRMLYRESRTGISDWTIKKDELSLKLLQDVIGDIQVRAVTNTKIEDFKRVCHAKGAKPITINGYLRHIKAAFSWALAEGYLDKKPRMKMFRINTEESQRFLEPEQIKAILRKAFKINRDMGRRLFFHLWTGTRRREGCYLTWPDVDFKKMEIRIHGKGGKIRMIPMLPQVAKVFNPVRKDIGKVFDDLHPDTVSHAFHEIADACGVKARLHDLRHTCATYLLKSGVPLDVVQKIMGHAHISTTQIYAQVLDEIKKREMQKLRFE